MVSNTFTISALRNDKYYTVTGLHSDEQTVEVRITVDHSVPGCDELGWSFSTWCVNYAAGDPVQLLDSVEFHGRAMQDAALAAEHDDFVARNDYTHADNCYTQYVEAQLVIERLLAMRTLGLRLAIR